jgi:hypothetical protein
MKPLHLHFGIGDLGIGAVMPVLSEKLHLVFVQVMRSGAGTFDWKSVIKNEKIDVRRQIEPQGAQKYQKTDNCVLPCIVHHGKKPLDANVIRKARKSSCVIFVDRMAVVAPLLKSAGSISCALKGGQADLAEVLLNNDGRPTRPVLAFENTLNSDLINVCGHRVNGWKLYPVITDRICGKRVSDKKYGRVMVPCERFLRMVTADVAQVRKVFGQRFVTKTGRGSDAKPVRLVKEPSLEFHHKRKRWLVNSLHEVLALFSGSTLVKSGIPLDDQFLPQSIEWSINHDKTLHYAVSLFVRMQAMRLAIESEQHEAAVIEFYSTTTQQLLYDTFVAEAGATFERMTEFADRIGRLFDVTQLKKELSKFDEHVDRAMTYVRDNEARFRSPSILGRPDVDELWQLREVLEKSLKMLRL